MKTKGFKLATRIVLVLFCLSLFQGLSLLYPKKLESATLTEASATLSNSRLSFYGATDTTYSAGATTIVLDTAGTWGDENTNHLFPNDEIAIGPNGYCGASGTTKCKVGAIMSGVVTFALAEGLRVAVSADDPIYATQSGSLTISFKTVNDIPASGDVRVLLPDPPSNGNDKAPDSTSSVATNGFDLNGIQTTDVTCSGGGGSWSTTSVTPGSGSGHEIICTTSTAATDQTTAITVTIDASPGLVNPAPVNTGHTQGTADVYTINLRTRDSSDNLIDEVDNKVAPVEAVLVSATVEETLVFTVGGLSTGTYCGQTTDVTTQAYSVPWGTLDTADSFREAAQQLTVSTNADGGYAVTIEENDQMGKDGTICNSPTDDTADETDNCIKDTTCSASTCSETTGYDWTVAGTYHGLGYTLANLDGTDAVFVYNSNDPCSSTAGAGTFCAKQIADIQAGNTKQTIMSNTGPVNSKDIYVCLRIAISATQPAGYYYNKVKYTATSTF